MILKHLLARMRLHLDLEIRNIQNPQEKSRKTAIPKVRVIYPGIRRTDSKFIFGSDPANGEMFDEILNSLPVPCQI